MLYIDSMFDSPGPVKTRSSGFGDITAKLRDRIAAGEFAAGAYLPTERELQDGFGASRTTIRKALSALVDSGWAMNVPMKGVVAGRGLKPGISNHVAFIHANDFTLGDLSKRLGTLLDKLGLHLIHINGAYDQPMETALEVAVNCNCVGALVWSYRGFPDQDEIRKVSRQLPIVALDHRIAGDDTDLVTFDHEAAAFEATEFLIRAGCRRIGVTGMLDMLEITHLRFRGYMRAMFSNGLQPLPQDFIFTFTSGLTHSQMGALEHALSSGDRPDGFLVLQDLFVPEVAVAVRNAGLSPSVDVLLSTIGTNVREDVMTVTRAAVILDWETLAGQAVELLEERLSNLHQPPKVCFAPHHLILGPTGL
jgi:LacI family transcriptional regulator